MYGILLIKTNEVAILELPDGSKFPALFFTQNDAYREFFSCDLPSDEFYVGEVEVIVQMAKSK